jgi:hypothetical protein
MPSLGYGALMEQLLEREVDERAIQAVKRLLHERMDRFGFLDAEVVPGRDHDGDPVLFVEADYRLSPEPIDPRVTFDLIGEVRRTLRALGESRFPHIRHHFADDQAVMESFER